MKIQHNMNSINTFYAMQKTRTSLQKNLEKLSSGYRINRASDDAAGLAISEKLRLKVTETGRCQRNVDEGLNVTRTADAALQEINDMLKRARSLCVESMNGAFSSNELSSINDEISMLFSEIDRITASTTYNSINLFRRETKSSILEAIPSTSIIEHKVKEFDAPRIKQNIVASEYNIQKVATHDLETDTHEIDDDGRKFHYEYEESIVPVTDGSENWGNLDLVSEETFDPASRAKAATAVIHLDKGIDFNDVTSLVGRSITIGTGTGYYGARTFYFTDGTVKTPGAPTSCQAININDPRYNTTEGALLGLCSEVGYYKSFTNVQSATLDVANKTITFTAELKDFNDGTYQADGVTYPNVVAEGLGDWANGTKIAYTWKDQVDLNQIDGEDARNNPLTYSDTATATVRLDRIGNAITAAHLKNLQGNSIRFGNHTINLKDLNLFEGMTIEQFGNALASKINEFSDCTATYNKSQRNLTLVMSGLSNQSSNAGDVCEITSEEIYHYDSQNMWTSQSASFNTRVIRNAASEWAEISEIDVQNDFSNPFSFSFNGTKYLYYNSNTHSLIHVEGAEPWFDYLSAENITLVDTAGMNQNQIMNSIGQKLAENIAGTATVSGNTISLTAGNLNRPLNLDNTLKGEAINVTSSKKIIDSAETSSVLSSQYSDILGTFSKSAQVSFSLGDGSNIQNLIGSGFSVGSCKIEFTNGTDLSTAHIDINIANCKTIEDLKSAIAKERLSNATLTIDDSNKNDIKLVVDVQNVVVDQFVIDGNPGSKGIMQESEAIYANGTNVGYSQKEIDFSSITENNLNDLLGTGFRINCPTCSGEYINIFFCWEKNDSMPTTFSRVDEETGATRTIHNIAVELSKIDDISQIAQNIVDQIRPTLNHFMDITVGESGATLVAKEKRVGDVTDESGKVKLGSIQAGVAANFKYEVIVKKVYDDDPLEDPIEPPIEPPVIVPDPEEPIEPDPVVPDPIKPTEPVEEPIHETTSSDLLIYVGSDPSAQYISIHLPYLDLDTLDLGCADVVSSENSRTDLLNRIDNADIMISSIRGTIGADQNRLEHAKNALSNYHNQLSDAYSNIRDTDVAHEKMKMVKNQILSQFQDAMLSQANQLPQHVIDLIQ